MNESTSSPEQQSSTPYGEKIIDDGSLAMVINDYRASLGLYRIPISPNLTQVAKCHVKGKKNVE